MRLALAVLAALVLAGPAAALTDPAVYSGTLAGKGVGKAQGLPAQKQPVSIEDVVLTLEPSAERFNFAIGPDSIGAPMKAVRRGAFKVLQPSGDDLTALIAGTEGFFANNLGLAVAVSEVKVTGRHKPSKDGLTDKSRIKLRVKGTALGLVPFRARATLRFAGAAPI